MMRLTCMMPFARTVPFAAAVSPPLRLLLRFLDLRLGSAGLQLVGSAGLLVAQPAGLPLP